MTLLEDSFPLDYHRNGNVRLGPGQLKHNHPLFLCSLAQQLSFCKALLLEAHHLLLCPVLPWMPGEAELTWVREARWISEALPIVKGSLLVDHPSRGMLLEIGKVGRGKNSTWLSTFGPSSAADISVLEQSLSQILVFSTPRIKGRKHSCRRAKSF